jgi:hypothetical protein
MLETLNKAIEIVQRIPEQHSCATCESYSDNGFCSHWNAKPPADFIEQGCEKWFSIPF